jgi:D-alanyl-D-alanine carboxypeptidase
LLSVNELIQAIDNLTKETYKPSEPGAAIILAKDGKIVFRKGLGMANLEFMIPIEPDMVFRLGSITKQFTAVAILMLAERGRLNIDDSVNKFLPEYPMHDHTITIEHLLTHTSGIKSYTNMQDWPSLCRNDYSVEGLIAFFKDQPIQFAPGTRWAYNNSGYILLGAIIEKVTGQTYEQFIQQNIFNPLGMIHSFYDSPIRVIQRRVAGYNKGPEGYTNAMYLSMTQPYSAGALASTVDDLVIWDSALHTEQLLSQESLQQAFTPHQFADGSSTAYGYGWKISEYEGHRLVEHDGDIQGFKTHAIRMPDDHVFVAILSNNGGTNPEQFAFEIAALAIDRPYTEPPSIELNPGVLTQYQGVYQINGTEEGHIVCEDSKLFSQHGQNPRVELVPFSSTEFYFKDNSCNRLSFIESDGIIIGIKMHGRTGIPLIAKKIAIPAINAV